MGYAPLDFLNTMMPDGTTPEIGNGFSDLLDIAEQRNFDLPKDEDEVLKFALSQDFLDESYNGPFKGLNNFAIFASASIIPEALSELQTEEERKAYRERVKKSASTMSGDAKDLFFSRIIFDKWARNKQVYKLDGTFAKVLGNTDRFSLTRNQLEHLPTNCFYLDLEDAKSYFGPVNGVFVFVLLDGPYMNAVCYILHEKNMFYSEYLRGMIDNGGDIALGGDGLDYEDGIHYKRILSTVLQFFSYLSVKEPDIQEDVTKHTYRKPTVIRNKFSEVQRYEVGVRIGKTLTDKTKAWKAATGEKEAVFVSEKEIKTRKSPKPYIRCAHWQRYHTGKGRVNTELRWKEPVFCFANKLRNANGKEIDTDVVIHKVDISH